MVAVGLGGAPRWSDPSLAERVAAGCGYVHHWIRGGLYADALVETLLTWACTCSWRVHPVPPFFIQHLGVWGSEGVTYTYNLTHVLAILQTSCTKARSVCKIGCRLGPSLTMPVDLVGVALFVFSSRRARIACDEMRPVISAITHLLVCHIGSLHPRWRCP